MQVNLVKTFTKKEKSLDGIDRAILKALDSDARLSIKALSRQVGLSAPSCGERLKQLERGVIQGYSVQLNPQALGHLLQTLVRVKALPGQMQHVEQWLQACTQCVTLFKVTGEDDFVCVFYMSTVEQLDAQLEALGQMARTHTSLIKTAHRKLPPF